MIRKLDLKNDCTEERFEEIMDVDGNWINIGTDGYSNITELNYGSEEWDYFIADDKRTENEHTLLRRKK